jgi:lipoprotein-anchoring transpeptidase ErfK/SrfK
MVRISSNTLGRLQLLTRLNTLMISCSKHSFRLKLSLAAVLLAMLPAVAPVRAESDKSKSTDPTSVSNQPKIDVAKPTPTQSATTEIKLKSTDAPIVGKDPKVEKSSPSTSTTAVNPKPAVSPATNSTPKTTANPKPDPVAGVNLVLKLKEKKVYIYRGEEVLNKFPVAIGKRGTETPKGKWRVMQLIKNPGWTNFKNGKVVKPGPNNPLGERWIGFWSDGTDVIGFHGTPDVKSVGTAASNGCVRMYNEDVKVLFDLVKVGTEVKVVP